MNLNYEQVPKIITGKDLDYLKDMFGWNKTVVKAANHFKNEVENEEIRSFFEKVSEEHLKIMNQIVTILNEGGQNNE